MGVELHLVYDLGQEHDAHDAAGLSRVQRGDAFLEPVPVPADGGAEDSLDQVGFAVITCPDVPENGLQAGGQAFDEG